MGASKSKDDALPDFSAVNIRNDEEVYFDLSCKSRFQRYEIRRLHGAFRNICQFNKSKNNLIEEKAFIKFFSSDTQPTERVQYLFKAFKHENHGGVSLSSFVIGLDQALLGSALEKASFLVGALEYKRNKKVYKDVCLAVLGPVEDSKSIFVMKNKHGREYAHVEQFREWATLPGNVDFDNAFGVFKLLPSVEEEAEIVREMFQRHQTLQPGSTWYALSQRWWQAWKDYVAYDQDQTQNKPDSKHNKTPSGTPQMPSKTQLRRRLRPISIENADLSGGMFSGDLKMGLVENVDYTLVPKEVWLKLVEWYGGGPEYPRKVIEVGGQTKMTRVEVFLLGLYIVTVDPKTGDFDRTNSIEQLFSCQTPLAAIESLARTRFQIQTDAKTRLWVCDSEGERRRLTGENPQRQRGNQDLVDQEPQPKGDLEEDLRNEPNGGDVQLPDYDEAAVAEDEGNADGKAAGVSIGDCDIEHGDILMLEVQDDKGAKRGESSWPLDRIHKAYKDWKKMRKGDVLDARDRDSKWYKSEIVQRNEDEQKVLVHFQGWDSKYDEWIPLSSSDRFAAPGRHSKHGLGKNRGGSGAAKKQRPITRGVVGLRNLGNTCFMNSTLQCLSNTPIFNTFFSGGRYVQDINKVNPLGTKGKLANAFGTLLKEIWMGNSSSVAPSAFKRAVGHFQPRFSGYQQQDSQELLAYLLDGLHEDLNRVKKKTVTQSVEAKGRPDQEVAEESWQVYQLRNRSVIVDLFMGQLKSTLVCPDVACGNVSVTFDPFMYLSVPFPRKSTRRLVVNVVHIPPRSPQSYVVTVEASGKCRVLFQTLMEMARIQYFVCGEIYKSKLYRFITEESEIGSIRQGDVIVAYELPDKNPQKGPEASEEKGRGGEREEDVGEHQQAKDKETRQIEQRTQIEQEEDTKLSLESFEVAVLHSQAVQVSG